MSSSISIRAPDIPIGMGPPTKVELVEKYPSKFSWEQLRTFINVGDLGLLKRDKAPQKRYDTFCNMIREQYGSNAEYLAKYRLRWGKPDTLSLLQSELVESECQLDRAEGSGLEASPTKEHFTASTPKHLISVILNDWPYSIPTEVEHTLIWTKLPIIHSSLVHPKIAARINQDGIWGFTGSTSPPPPASALAEHLGALREWGFTMDQLVSSPDPTEEEMQYLSHVSHEVHVFVKNRWQESEWETAWFVNPPRLQVYPIFLI